MRNNANTKIAGAMKRYTILCGALLAAMPAVWGQQPTIDQQIEVTRQYVPEVEGARKLDFSPRMNDTVTLKPDIDYSITPTPWKTVFGTEPIAPVGISTAEYERPMPYYLRLGGGYPGMSMLDFYVDKSGRGHRFGVNVNHYGEWQRQVRPVEEGASFMPWTTNDIGVYAGRDFGRQSLDFRADLDLDYYDAFMVTDTRQGYFNQDLDIRLSFGDDFTDFTRFNYRVALSGGLAQLHVGYGRAEVNLGGRVGDGMLLGDVIFDGWWQPVAASVNSCDWYVALAPRYEATFGRFGLRAGLKFYTNRYKGVRYEDGFEVSRDSFYRFFILPDIDFSYKVVDAFVPYLKADGELGDGSYRGQHEFNPYAQGDLVQRPRIMSFGGGFRGDAASILSYDVQTGYSMAELLNFKLMENAWFDAFITPVDIVYVDADVKLRLPVGFSFEAGVRYNGIWNRADEKLMPEGGNVPVGTGLAPLMVTGVAGYQWRDRLFVQVGVEYGSQRYAATETNLYVAVPGYVDLWAEVMFKPTRKIGVFVRGGNLLNQPNYRYLVYRTIGANVLAGATFSF